MRVNIPEQFRNWLRIIIGRKLITIQGLIYVKDGEEKTSSPQELFLSFDSGVQGKLKCGSDGESLVWDMQELEAVDLGEYGDEVVRDLSYLSCWKNLIGHLLVDVKLIKSLRGSYLMGLLFSFDNDLSIVVVNLGDEIYMFESLPKEIAQEEEIRYFPIS